MEIKILLDENISRKVVSSLSERFHCVEHVANVGLSHSEDRAIWEYAKENSFVLITKDNDFQSLSMHLGFPPKVIRLKCGNVKSVYLLKLIIDKQTDIENFINSDESGFLDIQ